MEQYTVQKLGAFKVGQDGFRVELYPKYAKSLEGLDGFSHVQLIWWFSNCDDAVCRTTTRETSPYKGGPETLGTFASRSPFRPNPIALSVARVNHLDVDNATIWIDYADAENDSPVLDIKPYTPSLDRVEKPTVPEWCGHWPPSLEASGAFDWATVFNF